MRNIWEVKLKARKFYLIHSFISEVQGQNPTSARITVLGLGGQKNMMAGTCGRGCSLHCRKEIERESGRAKEPATILKPSLSIILPLPNNLLSSESMIEIKCTAPLRLNCAWKFYPSLPFWVCICVDYYYFINFVLWKCHMCMKSFINLSSHPLLYLTSMNSPSHRSLL